MAPALSYPRACVTAVGDVDAMGNSVGKEATVQESVAGDTGRPPRKEHEATRGSAAADERRTTEDSPTLVSGLRLVEGIVDTSGSPSEHDILVAWIRGTLERGRAGELPGNTYAPIPEKWRKRNQSREMLQFGTYTHSNRVETHVPVAPLPPELDAVVDALIARGALTELQRPDSCTINLYGPGQWIPPHIDNPAFDRPFVTVSLCSEQPMVLGRGMVWPEGGRGPSPEERLNETHALSLPVGSAVVVEGEAADEYEHAVPPVTAERISLTFRRRGRPGRETEQRTERAERCRRRCRDVRGAIVAAAEARAGGVRRGFGPVGPIGAVGRVGPIPAKPADRREGSVIKKPVVDDAEDVRGGVLSKNAAKKEARKAAKAAAKERARKAKPTTTAVDGTVFERKEKVRSCPACPPDLLPTTSDANESQRADAEIHGEDAGVSVAEALPSVERVHVQRVYDAVATQWHGTRYRAWSGVEDFVRRHVRPGSLVADVGCGNGKNLPEVESLGGCGVGCDFSVGLLEICAVERGLEVFAGDATCLPLRSRSFDVALNIAVLHHVSSEPRRRKLVTETMRLLTVGGTALFYAWALEQADGGVSGHHFESQDVLVPFHTKAGVQGKVVVTGGSGSGEKEGEETRSGGAAGEDDDGDPTAPRVYQRYCHVYKEGELETLFEHIKSWVRVNRVYFDCGNWCVEAERIA